MTEIPPEADEADAQEQGEDVHPSPEDDEGLPAHPLRDDVDERDAVEQERQVGVDEDEYR